MKHSFLFLVAFVFGIFCATQLAWSDEPAADSAAKLDKAKKFALEELYTLRYKFTAGETFRTKVVHLVTVETKIQGTTETAKTRSVSTKLWKITDVATDGNITFQHSVESVDMWQKMTGRAEISFNSDKDDKAPAEYQAVADSLGKPLATITITPQGKVLDRDKVQFNGGIGSLAVPLPEQAVKVGQDWFVPYDVPLRLEDKTIKTIKTRQRYTLLKVETGIATISMKTEVLTPVNDPKIQSQLVQRLQDGTIKFDIDAGRIRSKQMDLDETVLGFAGQQSVMQYLARLTEEVTAGENLAEKPAAKRK